MSTCGVSQLHFSRGSEISTIRYLLVPDSGTAETRAIKKTKQKQIPQQLELGSDLEQSGTGSGKEAGKNTLAGSHGRVHDSQSSLKYTFSQYARTLSSGSSMQRLRLPSIVTHPASRPVTLARLVSQAVVREMVPPPGWVTCGSYIAAVGSFPATRGGQSLRLKQILGVNDPRRLVSTNGKGPSKVEHASCVANYCSPGEEWLQSFVWS